jgi:hypothetical protein
VKTCQLDQVRDVARKYAKRMAIDASSLAARGAHESVPNIF